MKAGEALKILHVTMPTLYRYRDRGYIKATQLPSGQYDYDKESIFQFLNQGVPRETCLYGRVSTYKQKPDLSNQMTDLETFAKKNGYTIKHEFSDVASGISFKNRHGFFKMLDLILDGKVEYVIITHKDRLSRVGFDLFKHLFDHFGTKIIVMSDYLDPKTDEQELFSEIMSLLHCFAMKSYSARRKIRGKI